MDYLNRDNPVYISYSWSNEANPDIEDDVKALCALMEENGIFYKLDKAQDEEHSLIGYGDVIQNAEYEIAKGNAIIVVFSPKYFKSPHCLHELHCIINNPHFERRVYPIWLSTLDKELSVFDMLSAIEHVKIEIECRKRKGKVMGAVENFFIENCSNGQFMRDFERLGVYIKDYNIPDHCMVTSGNYSAVINKLKKHFEMVASGELKETIDPKSKDFYTTNKPSEPAARPQTASAQTTATSGRQGVAATQQPAAARQNVYQQGSNQSHQQGTNQSHQQGTNQSHQQGTNQVSQKSGPSTLKTVIITVIVLLAGFCLLSVIFAGSDTSTKTPSPAVSGSGVNSNSYQGGNNSYQGSGNSYQGSGNNSYQGSGNSYQGGGNSYQGGGNCQSGRNSYQGSGNCQSGGGSCQGGNNYYYDDEDDVEYDDYDDYDDVDDDNY